MSHHIFIVRPHEGVWGVWENKPDWQTEEPLVTYDSAGEARAAADRAMRKYETEDWKDDID